MSLLNDGSFEIHLGIFTYDDNSSPHIVHSFEYYAYFTVIKEIQIFVDTLVQ